MSISSIIQRLNRDTRCDFFIASYPRSGNTWLVNVLEDYLSAQRAEFAPSPYGGDLRKLKNGLDVKFAGSYTPNRPVGVKTHWNRYRFRDANPPDAPVIYVLRDVRDVMVSQFMYEYGFRGRDPIQAEHPDPHLLLSFIDEQAPRWREHVTSWLMEPSVYEVLTVRYEELKGDFASTLQRVEGFLGIPPVEDISEIQRRYLDEFNGKDNHQAVFDGNNSRFYRKGVVGDWKNYFNPDHLEAIKESTGQVLLDLGYEKNNEW